MKSKIILLVGESAAGKDTILNDIIKLTNWHRAVSYTTRPPRVSETDGKDYHFLTSNEQHFELKDKGLLYEETSYETNMGTWYYGLGVDSFVDDKHNITIVNPHGLEQLMRSELKDRLITFYITAPLEVRLLRYLNRDEITDKQKIELIDRIVRDINDFGNRFEMKSEIVNYFNTDIWDSGSLAKEIIREVEVLTHE